MTSAFSRSQAVLLAALLAGACSRRERPAGEAATVTSSPDAAVALAPAVDPDAGAARPAAPTPSGAGESSARPDAPDAGTLASDGGITVRPAPLSAAVAVVGGEELAIDPAGGALVDPGASFRVEIAVPLTDGRLALHDEQDAMVASSGTSEVGTSWTRYRLVPDEPLVPGTSYALRVDGAAARELHDPSGRAYAPVVLKLKTKGERPPSAPARKHRGKRRR